MARQILALALAVLVVHPVLLPAAAAADQTQHAAKIKAKVQHYAAKQERVTIAIPPHGGIQPGGQYAEIRGLITEVGENDFVLATGKKGEPRRFTYAEVERVSGRGLHPLAKVAIGVGILFGALLATMLATGKS